MPCIQLRGGALRHVVELHQPAAERLRDLHAQDHRQLAVVDHVARLERVGDDPEPALARAAVLGVDVALHLPDPLRLQADALHLIAACFWLERVELAENPVLDQQVDEDPQAAALGSLEPAVVGLLVGEGLVMRPVLEGRPPDRVVAAGRIPEEDVLEHGACSRSGWWSRQSTSA